MSDVISIFMDRYNKEFDFYLNLSKKVEDEIRIKLHAAGVRAIVSSRAKSPKRLKDKIVNRNSLNPYQSVESVYEDIVDLAGVRVALYFPGDMTKIEEIISTEFILEGDSKSFPEKKSKQIKNNEYEKVFSGYAAKHFRVKMKGSGRYSNNHPVEIQVASVLMHAWSEVEHDLVYKPLQGNLSREEFMILDEINGLVLSGNLALERLQLAGIKRTETDNYEFKNHYDLASFFITGFQEVNVDNVDFNDIFKILKLMGKTKRNELVNIIDWINSNPINKENLQLNIPARARGRRGVPHKTYAHIIKAIAHVFPAESVDLLENCANDDFGDFELNLMAKEYLLKEVCGNYLASKDSAFIESIVSDYEIFTIFESDTNENVIAELVNSKKVSFTLSNTEIVSIFDDYIETKERVSVDSFSKSFLEDLISKHEKIRKVILNPRTDKK